MKQNSTTSNTEETITISRAEYDKLQSEIAEMSQKLDEQMQKLDEQMQKFDEQSKKLAAALIQNDWLIEQLKLNKKKLYGKSSEVSEEAVMDQLSLMLDEAEAFDRDSYVPEPEPTKVKGYTRKRRSGSIEDVIPEGLPVETVEHKLSEEERKCPQCGEEMVIIGKEVRETLKIEPPKFSIIKDIIYIYACKKCEKESGEAVIKKTEHEPAVLPGSYASPEAIAHIMTQKYVMYSPLYRQEQEMNRAGIKLSRQTMANWLLHASDDWLKPIYDRLHEKLCAEEVLHADETTLQVLKEPGKTSASKSYMWLYRTSGCTEHPIVLYEYKPNRKPENARSFLQSFRGWLHADGYQGYHTLPEEIRTVGCWAHARRKYDEALHALPEDVRKGSHAAKGLAYITKLYAIEAELSEKLPKEQNAERWKIMYEERLRREKPVLDEYLSWVNSLLPKTAPKSALGKALHYTVEQWQYLIRYLEDGRLEIDNNRAERSIKPFVMGRKNWMFANTPAGAQSSAVIYSLVETAKENHLDPYRYLLYVLKTAPKLFRTTTDWVTPLLPGNAPEECRTK